MKFRRSAMFSFIIITWLMVGEKVFFVAGQDDDVLGLQRVSSQTPDQQSSQIIINNMFDHPTGNSRTNYLVSGSRIVRPGAIYRVNVAVPLDSATSLIVRALITKDRQEMASSIEEMVESGTSRNLLMKMPASLSNGQYRIRVEGYDFSSPQKNIFIKEAVIDYNPDFLSIVVQTNRKVFRNEMTVRFRVVLSQLDLKPYADPVTIFILDPNGFIVRRWPSRYPRTGVVTLAYQLPSHPPDGRWTIRVEALTQIHDHEIFVERFYYRFFDVIPSAPAYVLDSAESYTAAVTTSFHPGRVDKGNITITILAKPINSLNFQMISEESPPWVHDFTYDVQLKEVQQAVKVNSLVGWVIRVAIKLYHNFMGETREGFIETRIIHAQLRLKFAGTHTAVMKPGMPFEGHVYAMYDDDQALSVEKLTRARLSIKAVVTLSTGQLRNLPEIIVPPQGEYQFMVNAGGYQRIYNEFDQWMEQQAEEVRYKPFRTSGVHHFRIQVPKDASSMRVIAYYRDEEDQVITELQAVAFYSSRDFHIHISTSTEEAELNEYAIFHLKTNFDFQTFNYVVISKGMVIHGDQQNSDYSIKSTTFAVPVATEMAPTFKLVVMVINPLNELVADSVTIPVRSINRYKMNLTMVQNRDHSKRTVQVVTRSKIGAFTGVSLLRSAHYIFQADNELTPSRMLRALYELEPFSRSVNGITWTDREGMQTERSQYLTGSNPGADTKRTLSLAGLLIFTDAKITQHPETVTCDKNNGYEPCLVVGCFHIDQKCNGQPDCKDGSDEDDCAPLPDDRMDFRIFRRNRFHDYYDWMDGDWAWYDIPVTDDGIEYYDRSVAATNEVWYINAFSFHAELGFAILDDVVEYVGSPPFYYSIESPSSVRRGEMFGIRMLAINNLDTPVDSLIILEASDEYLFVETGPEGEVEHFKPSLVRGEKHHLVTIKPMSTFEVMMPISPQIEQGTITVNIRSLSQIRRQDIAVEVEILPEGVTITRHTSMMLDLKNRAHLLRFLDIPVEESPIIPYSKLRRYVFGSPRASVTLCSDVFGPVLPSSPVSTESFLNRPLRGTEALLFNIATTSWSLHYLRLTNQLTTDVLYNGLNEMNVHLADLMRLYDKRTGAFVPQTYGKPSIYITAWVIRVLGQSQFQDWENHYFVDRKLLTSCVQWILKHQKADGAFEESLDYYDFPLDRRLLNHLQANNTTRMAGHTSHVLIALTKCDENLEGNIRVVSAIARTRAVKFLERILPDLKDPYDVAIVTHALTLSNSPAQETSFGKLHRLKREDEGMIYWSREPVPSNRIVYENQRPFVQPRPPTDQDSVAVEATSYALLVYLARDGIGELQERVVTWLNTMRMADVGFVSIFDSMIAMEALTEYAYRARLREITEMTVLVDASASPGEKELIKISSGNLPTVHQIEIPNVWGHINIIGRGAGQAVLQLKIQYGVDWEDLRDKSLRPYFDISVEEKYSHFRNKSHITVETCVKWLAVEETPMSGEVTIEVESPSGYGLVQSDADVEASKFSFLKDVLVANNKVIWMLEKVGPEKLCFRYELRRWFPVANMTMYRSAMVYETYSPEHFEMKIFDALPLYVLDICEVCGSFQCPYCPYFSSSPSLIFININKQLIAAIVIYFVGIYC